MNKLGGLALCWRIERTDGAGLALTSHDRELVVDGIAYQPSPGLMPAALHRPGGLTPGSAEIEGSVNSAALTADDLAAGRWNAAAYRLELVDWADGGGLHSTLAAGEIGEVSMAETGFTAELSGPAAVLDEPFCPATSSECRAAFGSRECRIDVSGRRMRATIVSAAGNRVVTDPPLQAVHGAGRLQVVSGPASGWQSVILGIESDEAVLRDAPWHALPPGSAVWIEEGCDKRFATCRERFGNTDNFRGEPYLPGNDLLTRYPGG